MSRFAPRAGIGVEVEGDAVYAAHLPDGPIVVLDGAAAAIWHEACADGGDLVARVAERTGAAPGEIAETVRGFVDRLVGEGLLEPRD